LADFYTALADAEERHADIFLDLARPLVSADVFAERLEVLAARETEVLADLPHTTRVH
jgi:tRNA isopentenyl-2-thiomethyl-A-37 hydroxylase MiaE